MQATKLMLGGSSGLGDGVGKPQWVGDCAENHGRMGGQWCENIMIRCRCGGAPKLLLRPISSS